jgi:uncharacterized membrane protein
MKLWTDERLERFISTLLRTGVLVSGSVVLAGGICYLLGHGTERTAYRVYHEEAAAYRSMRAIVGGAAHLDCRAVIQFGLLLLIATPMARVALSLAAFAFERDRTYVVITIIVLAILLYGLVSGR